MYYHPLFHRDHPEKLCQLRRRTCPGFDGRRNNKSSPAPLPPPRYSYDEISSGVQSQGKVSPATGGSKRAKVSRSPSPSSTPSGNPPTGSGSIRVSARLSASAAKSFASVSDEEVSPVTSKKQKGSSSAKAVTPAAHTPPLQRTVSNATNETMVAPSKESEQYVANKLQSHIQSTSLLEGIVDTNTSKKNSDEDEDDFHYYTSTNRKKLSKEEQEELQDHRYEVSEVSRRLDGICSDYAKSMRPSGGRRGGRVGAGSGAASSLQFGLDKPENAYSGTKCDLFTYDYEEGEYIVEDDHRHALLPVKEEEMEEFLSSPSKVEKPRPVSPSMCPSLTINISHRCLEGYRIMPTTTTLERTVASAILSFCLATHPEDQDVDIKLRVHLQRGPMLAKEFEKYMMALLPSIDIGPRGRLQAWKSFSSIKLQNVFKALHDSYESSSMERAAIKTCAECWFPEVFFGVE